MKDDCARTFFHPQHSLSPYMMSTLSSSLLLTLLAVSKAEYSVECGDGFTFGDNVRILTFEISPSSTELVTVHYDSTSTDHTVSIQIFDTNFKPQSNALPIGNPKHVDPTTEDPKYILSIFPNHTCTLSMNYFVKPDRVNLRTPNLIHRLFAWNSTAIYPLTDWFSSFVDHESNPYDIYGSLYISNLNHHILTELWFNRPSDDPPFETTLEFIVVNASNGALLSDGPDHMIRVNGSTSTQWDQFGINVCYENIGNNRNLDDHMNQWTVLYDTCASSDYCQNHGITYQLQDGQDGMKVIAVSDLVDWPVHYQGDSISSHCWQYSSEEIVICTTYSPTMCGIYDAMTLQNISDVVDVGIMYDPGIGKMILVQNEGRNYLVNCYLSFYNYLQCDMLDITDNFKRLIKGEYVFDIKCCSQQLDFVMMTGTQFVLSTTSFMDISEASTVQNCSVKFDAMF